MPLWTPLQPEHCVPHKVFAGSQFLGTCAELLALHEVPGTDTIGSI